MEEKTFEVVITGTYRVQVNAYTEEEARNAALFDAEADGITEANVVSRTETDE